MAEFFYDRIIMRIRAITFIKLFLKFKKEDLYVQRRDDSKGENGGLLKR